jgi:hypothetical protein
VPKFYYGQRVLFTDPETGEKSEWNIETTDGDFESIYEEGDISHAIIELENDSGSFQEVFLHEIEPLPTNSVKFIKED